MTPYKDIENNSEIESYKYDDDSFTFLFKAGIEKELKGAVVGFFELDCLKERADAGRGLDAYIREIENRAE